ncbi:MAG: polysaccharide pyruvyl transferase family protein [Clostridiaceae bacterium]|nr:polysaccharide pyruvyl transferase family protein [Clostridiaceae bacterium]
MIKIGILTFHRSINYGSFLQSYSLATALKSYTDFEVEIIDYNMTNVELKFLFNIVSRPVTQMHKSIVKYLNFKKALYNKLPISKEKFISNKFNKANKFFTNRYDVIIVGSDEVWKINKLRGFPNIYWLNQDLNCLKVSYAASANRTRFDKIEQVKKEYIRDSLSKYAYIGVRDQNTLEQLRMIDKNLNIKKNSDPTFMFDCKSNTTIINKIREKLSKKYKLDLNEPIMALMCTDDNICKKIFDRYSGSYQIVSLYVNTKYCNAFLYDLDPFEWAHVFRFFSISVTNFFHCTVFSIINNTPFISIDVEESSVLYESKIKDLLKRASMLENYFNLKHPSFQWENAFNQIELSIKTPNISKMKSFVETEKKYFFNFISELKNLTNKNLTNLEAKNE